MSFPLDIAAVFLPLAGAAFAGFGGRRFGDLASNVATCAGVLLSAVFSVLLLASAVHAGPSERVLFAWIQSGGFSANWGIRIDTLSAVMLAVVTSVSSMVHLYSIAYMEREAGKSRFMAYLSLFTFFMLALVTAPNLLQMFFGWEGVGLMSYLLIGFWYKKDSANDASMKAFLVNRVGDFGFLLGIFGFFALFGSVDFDVLFEKAQEMSAVSFSFLGQSFPALTVLCLLLFVGAVGKSAQLGLHTWLPDAMEGPTPVSALIHAATMVTAGVFMLARMSYVFEYAPGALAVVAVVGALTCIFAASIGLTQFDIKRVIAYSTMSQLGYMIFAAGVSAYSASIFHLMTHAFFKALLFLCAGVVIHALSGEQDMRKMGALRHVTPKTYVLMWIGSLALAGIGIYGIGFSGYYSKDLILEAALGRGTGVGVFAYSLGVAAAFMTAFYSGRLLFLTFHGEPREQHLAAEHAHEASWAMLGPLVPLALGALFAGGLASGLFSGEGTETFWNGAIFVLPEHNSMAAAEHVSSVYSALPVVCAVVGFVLSWVFYVAFPEMPAIAATAFGAIYRFVYQKFYFDELYNAAFVRPTRLLGGWLWKKGDDELIDGFGPDGLARLSVRLAKRVSSLETGYLYHYAFAMVLGLAGAVSWFWFKG